jgi:hypothetical protein
MTEEDVEVRATEDPGKPWGPEDDDRNEVNPKE